MEKYWLVCVSEENPEPYRYFDLSLARVDAEKVARENIGKSVTVLEAVCMALIEQPVLPPCKWEEAVKNNEVPF